MSQAPCPLCGAELESCGFNRSVTGLKWKHIDAVLYCGSCARFYTRTTCFLDGPMCKPDKLAGIREAEYAAFKQARAEWLHARALKAAEPLAP